MTFITQNPTTKWRKGVCGTMKAKKYQEYWRKNEIQLSSLEIPRRNSRFPLTIRHITALKKQKMQHLYSFPSNNQQKFQPTLHPQLVSFSCSLIRPNLYLYLQR